MRDIIKKTRFSQGNIYRYYKSITEIFVAAINQLTPDIDIEDKLERTFQLNISEKDKLIKIFTLLGEYFDKLINAIGPKMYFELPVYAYMNPKNWSLVSETAVSQAKTNAILIRCRQYLIDGIQEGRYILAVTPELIMDYIDGILMATSTHAMLIKDQKTEIKTSAKFQILGSSIADLLLQ